MNPACVIVDSSLPERVNLKTNRDDRIRCLHISNTDERCICRLQLDKCTNDGVRLVDRPFVFHWHSLVSWYSAHPEADRERSDAAVTVFELEGEKKKAKEKEEGKEKEEEEEKKEETRSEGRLTGFCKSTVTLTTWLEGRVTPSSSVIVYCDERHIELNWERNEVKVSCYGSIFISF